jgi:hypothetical protein
LTASARDPFRERAQRALRRRYRVLGCTLQVHCDHARLAALADAAFGALARGRPTSPSFSLTLRLTEDASRFGGRAPPAPRMSAGDGWLCGIVDPANYALVWPDARRALVCLSPSMLRYAYHARYELVEFAVLTLLARGADLAPLHAGCIGRRAGGLLLIGDSGAGKSTLCGAALASGWSFVAEDATFVAPRNLWATGIPAFLHLHGSSLNVLNSAEFRSHVRDSPHIRRRSGVRKHEVDLRDMDCRLAPDGLPLRAIVVLRRDPARGPALRRVTPSVARVVLRRTQPYASGQRNWSEFLRHAGKLPAFELWRTAPDSALGELRLLLEQRP